MVLRNYSMHILSLEHAKFLVILSQEQQFARNLRMNDDVIEFIGIDFLLGAVSLWLAGHMDVACL